MPISGMAVESKDCGPARVRSCGFIPRWSGPLLLSLIAAAIVILNPSWVPAQQGRVETRTTTVSGSGARRVIALPEGTRVVEVANKDSLKTEIRKYSQLIQSLRDSLSGQQPDLELTPAQREQIQGNIEEISSMIEHISTEIGQMEFEIRDNTISLVNKSGEGIIINIPENLDEQLSEGIQAITEVILSELPDSVDFDSEQSWNNWSSFAPRAPRHKRKVVQGDLVKVWDDLHLTAKEDLRGNVVVVFGDTEISGRVDGNVVVVFGDIFLDETAEVTGRVVAIGGRLDQDPDAAVGDVMAVDLFGRELSSGLTGVLNDQGLVAFLIFQGTFLLTVLMAIIAVVVAPPVRFQAVKDQLNSAPIGSVGMGFIASLIGNLAAVVLMGVLVFTLIGVPLALLVFLFLVVVAVLSVAVSGVAVGNWLCDKFGATCKQDWLKAVVGMAALHTVSFLAAALSMTGAAGALATALGALGVLIKIAAYFFGLGALVISRLGSRKLSAASEPS